MRVFISWSGPQSRLLAEALRDWLPLVIQAVKPWVSAEDIGKGETWFAAIQDSLKEAKGIGIFCLTPTNLMAPWLAFEAGALSSHDRGRVATLLMNVDANSVKPPLSLFQATNSHQKSDVFKLLSTINGRLDDPLDLTLLKKVFEANWDAFQKTVHEIAEQGKVSQPAHQSPEAMLEEILSTVRRLEKDAAAAAQIQRAQELPNRLRLNTIAELAQAEVDRLGTNPARNRFADIFTPTPLPTLQVSDAPTDGSGKAKAFPKKPS